MTGQRGVVYGHSAMVSYLSWYEESARYLARVRPDLKIINATEGGVRIRGFEEVPLKRVIELCGQSTFEIHPVLNRRLAGSQARGRRVMEKLQEMLQDLSTRKEPGRPLSAGSLASELYDWIREGKEEEATFESMEDARSMVQTLMEKTRSAECE